MRNSPIRRTFVALTVFAALALLIAACGSGTDENLDPGAAESAPDYGPALAEAPPKLAELYGDGEGRLVDGGVEAFERQIAKLRGTPIVVNKWASWCGPCRAEFPHLQNQAAEHLDQVAFIGIDSDDAEAAAETFLRDHPIPYPSFSDPDQEIARSLDMTNFPETAFFDSEGNVVHIRRGVYADEQELAADIEKYALSELR